MNVKLVPKEQLIALFPNAVDLWWEPDVCPYPAGNVKKYLEPVSPQESMGLREKRNREYWSGMMKRRHEKFQPYGYTMMLWNLKGFITRKVDRSLYKAYQPQGFVFLPLTETDENGVGFAADHFHDYDLIVEDQTRYSAHQPSFRPVLLVKFAFIADEMSNTGYHREEGGPHGYILRFKWEQAFETLFDILVIDPRKHIALHWMRDDRGAFPKTAVEVGERDRLDLKGLDISLTLADNVLFYGSVEVYEKQLREAEREGRVRITVPELPVPDFSHVKRVFIIGDTSERIDLGQSHGPMADGRMWHMEVTATADGKIFQTYFFSKIGIEKADAQALVDLIKASHKSFEHDPQMPIEVSSAGDRNGHYLWAVEMCVIDGERRYTDRYPYYWPYDPTLPDYPWPDLIHRYRRARDRGAAFLLLCQDTWDAAKQDPDLGYYVIEVESDTAAAAKLQELDLGDYRGAGRDRCVAVIDASNPGQPFNEGVYHRARGWMARFERAGSYQS